MNATDTTLEAARILRVELEIMIDAPREAVWRALVEETTFWWREDYYATPAPHRFVIEPWLGGRAYEDTGNGTGITWYTVQGIETGRFLNLSGFFFPPVQWPAMQALRLSLEEVDATHTRFRVQDAMIGAVECVGDISDGWNVLFAALKSHAEKSITT